MSSQEQAESGHYSWQNIGVCPNCGKERHLTTVFEGAGKKKHIRQMAPYGLPAGTPVCAECESGWRRSRLRSVDGGGQGGTVADAVRHALLDGPVDLWAAMRDESPPRELIVGSGGLISRGYAHTFFGERESGKSMVVAVLLVSMAAAGERVLYLDRENGDRVTSSRIRDILDANPQWREKVNEHNLVGKFWPALSAGWTGEDVAAALDGFTVVVLDSTREFIGQLDGSNNSDDDVTRLMNLLVTPLVSRGVTVILTDNTGHENTHRQKGAGAKGDSVPVAFRVIKAKPFTPDDEGIIEIVCMRSRHGDTGRAWKAAVGGGTYALPECEDEAPDIRKRKRQENDRDDYLIECVRFLREHGQPMTASALIDALRERGHGRRKADALRWLRWGAEAVTVGLREDDSGLLAAVPDSFFIRSQSVPESGSQT